MTVSADRITAAEAEVAHRLAHGDALNAFDSAASARRAGIDSLRLRYLLVRSLAASGDSMGAMHLYEQLELGASDDVDSLALAGRIWKDAAFDREGSERARLLQRAAAAYDHAWRISGASFPAINAASIFALLGDRERAAALAEPIAANGAADNYWDRATLIEALLLLNRGEEALRQARARDVRAGAGDRASTCRQLARLSDSGAIDPEYAAATIAELRPAPVGVYCGRMFRAGGTGEAGARAAIAAAATTNDTVPTANAAPPRSACSSALTAPWTGSTAPAVSPSAIQPSFDKPSATAASFCPHTMSAAPRSTIARP